MTASPHNVFSIWAIKTPIFSLCENLIMIISGIHSLKPFTYSTMKDMPCNLINQLLSSEHQHSGEQPTRSLSVVFNCGLVKCLTSCPEGSTRRRAEGVVTFHSPGTELDPAQANRHVCDPLIKPVGLYSLVGEYLI